MEIKESEPRPDSTITAIAHFDAKACDWLLLRILPIFAIFLIVCFSVCFVAPTYIRTTGHWAVLFAFSTFALTAAFLSWRTILNLLYGVFHGKRPYVSVHAGKLEVGQPLKKAVELRRIDKTSVGNAPGNVFGSMISCELHGGAKFKFLTDHAVEDTRTIADRINTAILAQSKSQALP